MSAPSEKAKELVKVALLDFAAHCVDLGEIDSIEDFDEWSERPEVGAFALLSHIAETEKESARLRDAARAEMEVQQALAKALGYPRYVDLPDFPDATEETGYFVGEHVAVSLADETAARIERLEAELEAARGALESVWRLQEGCPTGRDPLQWRREQLAEARRRACAGMNRAEKALEAPTPTESPEPQKVWETETQAERDLADSLHVFRETGRRMWAAIEAKYEAETWRGLTPIEQLAHNLWPSVEILAAHCTPEPPAQREPDGLTPAQLKAIKKPLYLLSNGFVASYRGGPSMSSANYDPDDAMQDEARGCVQVRLSVGSPSPDGGGEAQWLLEPANIGDVDAALVHLFLTPEGRNVTALPVDQHPEGTTHLVVVPVGYEHPECPVPEDG